MSFTARWTIGPVQPAGFECLRLSICNFARLYDAELVICHNGLSDVQVDSISDLPARLIRQEDEQYVGDKPIGVAWKLTPACLDPTRHEVFIDNDLILTDRLNEMDTFLTNNETTLLLEAESRHYGRFEKHVPRGYNINSGLFGVPPNFNLAGYIALWGQWDENCPNPSRTWDEQGLVASALIHGGKSIIVPETTVTNCHSELLWATGMHFVGLNRREYHRPFAEYRSSTIPFLL